MHMKRWFISVAVACIGFLVSFVLSFKVNNFDTSLIRGCLSFIASFALYELLRFVVLLSLGDLIKRDQEEQEIDTIEDEKHTYVDENIEIDGETPPIDEKSNQNVQNTSGKPKDSITIQSEDDYADVAKFVKTELAKSDAVESESKGM